MPAQTTSQNGNQQPNRFSQERWEQLLDETIRQIRSLSTIKGGEYAGDLDRLENFRRNAAAMDLTMEQVWRVYAGKHWDALTQWVKDRAAGIQRPRAESLLGRADDLIVYGILLKAMILESEDEPGSGKLEIALNLQVNERTCDHQWHKLNRHTDTCVFCNTLRDHRTVR